MAEKVAGKLLTQAAHTPADLAGFDTGSQLGYPANIPSLAACKRHVPRPLVDNAPVRRHGRC